MQEDKEKADAKNQQDLHQKKQKKRNLLNMRDIPERTQRPRTEAEMKQQLNADVLMTLGTAIGGSATPSEIFQKLSGLPHSLQHLEKTKKRS